MLEKFLKKSTKQDIIISLIFIVFGIALIYDPSAVISILSFVLGGIFIVMGILRMSEYISTGKNDNYLLAIAISLIIIGIIIMCSSKIILSAFGIIIGIWIIYAGIVNLQTAIVWKEYTSRVWLLSIILSIVTIIVGIYVLVNASVIMNIIGFIILIYGFINILEDIIFIKNIEEK
jgi:uncharacterized membrane protein HdeD (DUF308 family)